MGKLLMVRGEDVVVRPAWKAGKRRHIVGQETRWRPLWALLRRLATLKCLRHGLTMMTAMLKAGEISRVRGVSWLETRNPEILGWAEMLQE